MSRVVTDYHINDKVKIVKPNLKRRYFLDKEGVIVDIIFLGRHQAIKHIVMFDGGSTGSFFDNEMHKIANKEYLREY